MCYRHNFSYIQVLTIITNYPGLVPPIVAQRLMGNTGEILILIMILMAVTSTGSAEVIAVTSILVYDIYQLYLKVGQRRFFKFK